MENNNSIKQENSNDNNRFLEDYYCPCCGLDTDQLYEGYCKPCLNQKQYDLDTYNNSYDRWGKLTDEQRNNEIIAAINYRQSTII
jgi:hypothetical protein